MPVGRGLATHTYQIGSLAGKAAPAVVSCGLPTKHDIHTLYIHHRHSNITYIVGLSWQTTADHRAGAAFQEPIWYADPFPPRAGDVIHPVPSAAVGMGSVHQTTPH